MYGKIYGEQLFTAKELTIDPGARCTISDQGAYGLITVQGNGKMNRLDLECSNLIRFHQMTNDEVFCTESAARAGVSLREYERQRTFGSPAIFRARCQPRRTCRWRS